MDGTLAIRSPLPFQVIQRRGFVPAQAHEHAPGGPALGKADVGVLLEWDGPPDAAFDCRAGEAAAWVPLSVTRSGGLCEGRARVPAGGWHRLEVRAAAGGRTLARAAVEHFGVGEVFVIAGQSYAEGCNDELLRVEDAGGRAAACDPVRGTWAVAHDPQPNLADGGTIWPPMCDALLPVLRVPIGLANVAVGSTASRQWLPGEALFERLADAGAALGRFRAVLWQQGESDVIERTDADTYVQRIETIRAALARRWGFEPAWLPAKSTLHPTVYNQPAQEAVIRAAIERLWRMPGFRPGPDTDVLGGENRGPVGTRQHFTGLGQRRAGLMWYAAVLNLLNCAGGGG